MLTLFFMKEGPTRLRRDLSEEMKGQRGLCGKWIFRYKTLATVSNLIMIKISWSNLISHFQIQEMSFSKNAFSSQCIKYTKNKLSVKFLQTFIVLSFLYLTFKKKHTALSSIFFSRHSRWDNSVVAGRRPFSFLFRTGKQNNDSDDYKHKAREILSLCRYVEQEKGCSFCHLQLGLQYGVWGGRQYCKKLCRSRKGNPIGFIVTVEKELKQLILIA